MEKNEYYDFLTGIPNMAYFHSLAIEARDKVLERGGHCAIGYVDFNGMKYYNQKYGFSEGDKILKNFAALLIKYFGNEKACRIAQDNFVFFAETDDLENTMEALFKDVEEMTTDKSITIRVGFYSDSMGVVETGIACDRARYASDTIRNYSKSEYRFFDESMLRYEHNRKYVLDNLDRAISEDWIIAYFQPIVRAANGLVCDEEALARWVDPEKGMMSPADFIPVLEDSKQIYKVDLHIVDKILERMKKQMADGLYVVPISFNLSRTDFECCDVVREICTRMDNAGISRDMLTIEITESTLGSDFDFMKAHVEQFQKEGFHVWMDDFGSGYSSLDLLQTIHFDLIKLDMRFMKQFDNSDRSRVIITELIKMAVGLGIDTVTEGVERQDQVDFLREVGCTKLQGYFYSKPIPYEEILNRHREGRQIGFENPDETYYYESLGRINLYDLSAASDDASGGISRRYFDTLPMAIVETNEEQIKIVRCNRSYRKFLERFFSTHEVGVFMSFKEFTRESGPDIIEAVRKCAETGERVFMEEKVGNDSTVHAFTRRIASNPASGVVACLIVVLGIVKDKEQTLTYVDVAKSLSADYIDLYHVNLDTEEFVEYLPDLTGGGGLSVERRGTDFFYACRRDAMERLYRDDAEVFVSAFHKENVTKAMDEHGSFTISYRLLIDGEPVYVNMKALRMSSNERYMIVGVSNVDAQRKQQEALERMKEERITYARISALAGNYIAIYTVDPVTDSFEEYGATSEYSGLGLDKSGDDFFERSKDQIVSIIHPKDYEMFNREFSKENVLKEVEENGEFLLYYRLIMNDETTYIRLKAAMVQEKDGPQLIVGVRKVDERFMPSLK